MTKPMDVVRIEFIEKSGLIAQNQGIPRIAGRVLGLLLFDGEAIPFGQLAQQLQVSRGSISTSTRLLESRALIKRVTKLGERQVYFQLAANPFPNMLKTVQVELDRAQADLQATVSEIGPDCPEIKARVQNYADLYSTLSATIKSATKTV